MKKVLLSAVLVVLVAGAGYLIYRYSGSPGQQTSASAITSVASSQAASSAVLVSSEESSQVANSSAAPVSSAAAGDSKQQSMNQIKTAVNLDWKKYTLKSSAQKTVKGKSYNTFDIWDDDYQVGPKVLVDPNDGKVYTWTSSDTAPIPVSEDKAFDKTVRTITGTIEDGAMMSIVLKTPDGNELVVRRLGIDTSGLKSMKVGKKVKVTYTGVIKGSDTSRAFITKLENVA